MCMKPAHTLNTWKVHTWAQVAQAVTWDDYALNSDGKVTVKATRGPVIVWGRRTGEGEDMPRLEAPTPTPLEVEAARVNVQAHALAFARAAHGKVRHSVRWKTRRKVNRAVKRDALICVKRARCTEARRARGLFDEPYFGMLENTFKEAQIKRQNRKIDDEVRITRRILERLPHLRVEIRATPFETVDPLSPIHPAAREFLEAYAAKFSELAQWSRPNGQPVYYLGVSGSTLSEVLSYSLASRDKAAICGIALHLTGQRLSKATLVFAQAIRQLVAVAYRAHALRRVQPVSRRARVPRPLYARPRPPTCPLAPPVA